jgi:pimeloyl-ACP methyl ester carboxylesterase
MSSLELCNFDSAEHPVELALLIRDQANPTPATVTVNLAAGACVRHEDVVGSLFGLDGTAGAIRVRTDGEPILALANTVNDAPSGTYGSGMPARPEAEAIGPGESAVLIHLSQSMNDWEGSRTNLDLLNLGDGDATVEIALYGGDGAPLGTLTTTLLPWEYDQLNRVFTQVTDEGVADGYAIVQTSTPGAGLLVTASVVDNRSGDVIAIAARNLDAMAAVSEEPVQFTNEDGYRLQGTLFSVEGASVGVVMAHSGVMGQSQLGLHPLARLLAARGLTVLTFDLRGYGDTGGVSAYGLVHHDVRGAIAHLRSLGFGRIALMGVGLGAIGAVRAADEPEVMGLAVISCPISVSPPALVINESHMAALAFPKLFIAAEEDFALDRPFAEYAETIYGYSAEPKTLMILSGSSHSMNLFLSAHGDNLTDLLVDFFDNLQ